MAKGLKVLPVPKVTPSHPAWALIKASGVSAGILPPSHLLAVPASLRTPGRVVTLRSPKIVGSSPADGVPCQADKAPTVPGAARAWETRGQRPPRRSSSSHPPRGCRPSCRQGRAAPRCCKAPAASPQQARPGPTAPVRTHLSPTRPQQHNSGSSRPRQPLQPDPTAPLSSAEPRRPAAPAPPPPSAPPPAAPPPRQVSPAPRASALTDCWVACGAGFRWFGGRFLAFVVVVFLKLSFFKRSLKKFLFFLKKS